jgi:FkbM family methyltransferase
MGADTVQVASTRYGSMLYNPNDIYVGRSIERYGEFSELEADLFRQLCGPGDTVFDVGANIGAHTLMLARHVGPAGFVYAFEAQRIVFQLLCANLALNAIHNVDAVHAVVGTTAGEERLPDPDYTQAGNFGGFGAELFGSGRHVRRVVLDAYADAKQVTFLKIDVEGMEGAVIAGAGTLLARHRPVLYLENDRPDKSPALIAQLLALDYQLFWHTPPLFNPENHRGDAEDIFPRIVSINMLGVPRERNAELTGFREITDPAARWNA